MNELDGVTVLVTRDREQARGLLLRIDDAGGRAHCIATVAIEPLPPGDAALRALRQCDCAIFTSANAVRHGARWISTPPHVAAVGPATHAALSALGHTGVIAPRHGHGGDALLALPELQTVAGRRIVVVRGADGLTNIQHTLQARGAIVHELSCYRRVLPQVDLTPRVEEWRRGDGAPLAATVTSVTHLDNLFTLAGDGGRFFLRQLVFIAAGKRIADACRRHRPMMAPRAADGASDEAMMRALLAWWGTVIHCQTRR